MSKSRSESKKRETMTSVDEFRNKDEAIVLFYATWCPFSQRFLPIFADYSKSNPEECVSIVIDDKPEVCEEYSIEHYPTVILFRKGKIHKRLDAEPGVGLDKKQLRDFTASE